MNSAKNVKPWFRKHDGWWYLTRCIDGKHVQTKLVRGRENEAEAFQRYFELMAAAGHMEPSTEISFNELAARFLSWSKREHDTRTTNWYVGFIDGFDNVYEGRVIDLRKSHVDHWLNTHPDWSVSTRRAAITAIKRVVNWGFEEGHLTAYPVGLRKLRRPATGKRDTVISEADHTRMLAASDTAFQQFLIALWDTGARPKEVRTVAAEMVHFDAGVWLLNDHKTAEKVEKPRIIYLTPRLVDLSRELAAKFPTGPIFRNSQGNPWTDNAVRCRMRRLREKLGLPEGTVAYAYRHSYATSGLENGIPIADMAELLGHRDTKMLSEHYGHLSKKTQRMRELAEQATRSQDADPSNSQSESI